MAGPAPGKRLFELESIRGMAALLIVLYHVPPWNRPIHDFAVFLNAHLMVELFFVLSGFVIHSAYATRIRTGRDVVHFQFLRFARLYPVHLVFLLAFLLIELLKLKLAGSGMASRSEPFGTNSWTAFFQQLFMVHAVGLTGNVLTFNEPAWSMSVVFWTCLLFAITVLLLGRRASHVFFLLSVGAMAGRVVPGLEGFGPLLRCFGGFFLGCCVASFVRGTTLRLPFWSSAAALAAIILLLAFKPAARGPGDLVIYVFSAALVLAIALSPPGLTNRILCSRPLTWLGTISYSIYLSHTLVLYVITQVLRRMLDQPETMINGRLIVQLSTGEAVAAYAFVLAAVLAVSWLTSVVIERPFRDLSRNMARPERRTAAVTA